MGTLDWVLGGLAMFLSWEVWLALAVGSLVGVVFGAIPGLTAMMGVGVFIPITFYMSPFVGIAMLIAIYKGGIYGGSIAGILVNVPGTPASIPATMDGYPLAQKGLGNYALTADALSSMMGGIIGIFFLLFLAPFIARFALRFGAVEFSSLFLFAMVIIAHLSRGSMLKGLISGALGFLIATVGIDPMVPTPRMTFGIMHLHDGVPRVVALIGMFAGAEVLTQLEVVASRVKLQIVKPLGKRCTLREIFQNWKEILIASITGVFIGMIPGPGAGTSSFIAYSNAKRRAKDPESFGKGNIVGVMVAEAANNAMIGGALITLFALGLPGDTVTAVLYGGVLIHGLTPGAALFINNPELMYGILISTVFATGFFALYGYFGARHLSRVLQAPKYMLWPGVWLLCFVGAYGLYNRIFDLQLIVVFGVIGYLLKKGGFPIAPLSLAIILGRSFEGNFRRALIRYNFDLTVFLTRPISLVLLLLTAFSVGHAIYTALKREKSVLMAGAAEAGED